MSEDSPAKHYPNESEVDGWLDSIWDLVEAAECPAELIDDQGFTHNLGLRHMPGFRYVRFAPAGMPEFFGYWQPAHAGPAPLLVHVPGYGAEMSAHPDLVAAGFNVLHVSPLGYSTPQGAALEKQRDGTWPVLPDTILSAGAEGYRLWLANCAMAVRWAWTQPEAIENRVSFFGTSQGGGAAVLLASLFRDRGVRCAAGDVAFLVDFLDAHKRDAYPDMWKAVGAMEDPAAAWRAIGLIDTLSHVHRLDLPILLTAGGDDETCPAHSVETLFRRLPGVRSYTYLKGTAHRYTTQFIPLAAAWFRLYA